MYAGCPTHETYLRLQNIPPKSMQSIKPEKHVDYDGSVFFTESTKLSE